jgi:glycosyltransferase involved in cell wall biosynthesis
VMAVMTERGASFEVIIINDGSKDDTIGVVRSLCERYPRLKAIDLARNYGQTAAIMAGLDHAQGDVIVPMDADLQNDPKDIPRLLDKLDEGFDVVSGWRVERKDPALRKTFVSRVANALISRLSGVRLHDFGCSLKAYRRSVIAPVRLYGEMHRFVPIYAAWYGARITEIPVAHRARLHGSSNYGLERIFKVVLDLMVVRFLDRWIGKPIYIFGGFGVLWLLVAALSFVYMLYLKLTGQATMIQTPLPVLSAVSLMMGAMSICLGLIAEIIVRTYFESQGKRTYHAREYLNFDVRPR